MGKMPPLPEPIKEEKPKSQSPLLITLAVLAIVGIAFGIAGAMALFREQGKPAAEDVVLDFKHYKIAKIEDEPIYVYKSEYDGNYQLVNKDFPEYVGMNRDFEALEEFRYDDVVDYEEYKAFCEKWDIEQKFTDEDSNYAIVSNYYVGSPNTTAKLAEVYEEYASVTIFYQVSSRGVTADTTGFAIIVPVDTDVTKVSSISMYTETEYENLKKYGEIYDPSYYLMEDKPIIYLYPEKEMEVSVKLGNAQNLTVSYPRYEDGWRVLAQPNGDLKDLKTGRNLYALYYETKLEEAFKVEKDGFVIAGEYSAEFLEKKLAILGLNDREKEEFIVYWLPKLEASKFNYIRFATTEEIDKNTTLDVYPRPDSVIRVWMSFKGLDEEIKVEEQKLETPERTGFTVVEWGGSELQGLYLTF